LKPWLALGIALVCMLPCFSWEVFSPRPIDLTAFRETVDYEFRDARYAEEFAALNQAPTGDRKNPTNRSHNLLM